MHAIEHIFMDRTVWQQHATTVIADAMRNAITKHGQCTIGLSGGSTPAPVYRALAGEDIDWQAVTLFLADERMVPPTDTESNHRLVQTELLDHLTNPPACVFPDTTLSPTACANTYDVQLRTLLHDHPADVLVLGLGPDGHTASLFPPVGDIDPDRLAICTQTDTFAVRDRISITPRVLRDALVPVVLLRGTEKLALWRTMTNAPCDPARWPLHDALTQDTAILLASP